MADLNRANSRFSSFRTFKFPSSKSKPPPVPPKDHFYLNNRSLPSLNPSPPSIPTSPSSPPYPQQQASPGPSQSTMSLASSTASFSPPPVLEPVQNTKRQRNFFRFPKRSPKSPSQTSHSPGSSVASPSAEEEESISLPWGFQHHTHVDESLSGLPPSWSASLAEVGYTDTEIAAINARRTATRSPTSQFGYDGRPLSPAIGNSIMLHPLPRSTSLLHSSGTPMQPTHNYGPSISTGGKVSIESSRLACESPFSVLEISSKADAQHIEIRNNSIKNHTNQSSLSSYHSSHASRSRNSSFASAADSSHGSTKSPRTKPASTQSPSTKGPSAWASPPKMLSNLSNGTPSSAVSLPPAYSLLQQSVDQHSGDPQRNKSISSQTSHHSTISNGRRPHATQENQEIDVVSDESAPQSNGPRTTLSQRLATLPPRLSLAVSDHVGDLSSWSEALLSAIPAEMTTNSSSSSTSSPPSKFASAQSSRAPPPLPLASKQREQHSSLSYTYPTPPDSETKIGRALTAILQEPSGDSNEVILVKRYDEDDVSSNPPTTATPLWDELMGMVQQPSPGLYMPAVNEVNSPTLPITPPEPGRRFRGDSFVQLDTEGSEVVNREGGAEGGGDEDDEDDSLSDEMERDPNRDSNTSTASVSTVTAITVVRKASLATRAVANVIRPSQAQPRGEHRSGEEMQMVEEEDENAAPLSAVSSLKHPDLFSESSTASPVSATGQSSNWGSPQSSPSTSEPGSASSNTPVEENERSLYSEMDPTQGPKTPAYLDFLEPSPTPSKTDFELESGRIPRALPEPLGIVEEDLTSPQRHMLAANALPTPITPAHRYPGWLSAVVAPLGDFIDDRTDPRDHYVDLQEIAEGESGSVYLARVVRGHKLRIPKASPGKDGRVEHVAIKNIPISPSGSPKLLDLERELKLLKGVRHEFVLGMDALYVDLVEDSLWIRMELMERSLADVVSLVVEGLMVQERMIARFASDVLLALKYLQTERIAHRDVRSDNLLLNKDGMLKIADFSNAVRVTPDQLPCSDTAGVLFWQAPEVRTGPYDPLKVDVWSLGATAWEMAQAVPPFSDIQDPRQMGTRLPPLSQPEIYGRTFHEFLRLCSEPASSRPGPSELLDTAFVRNACGRQVIIQLLAQCRTIEDRMGQDKPSES